MAKQTINLGTAPTGVGGDTPRSAFVKTQSNFDELYAFMAAAPITKRWVSSELSIGGGASIQLNHSMGLQHKIAKVTFRFDTGQGGYSVNSVIEIPAGAAVIGTTEYGLQFYNVTANSSTLLMCNAGVLFARITPNGTLGALPLSSGKFTVELCA